LLCPVGENRVGVFGKRRGGNPSLHTLAKAAEGDITVQNLGALEKEKAYNAWISRKETV
jgi:hypothetical protein